MSASLARWAVLTVPALTEAHVFTTYDPQSVGKELGSSGTTPLRFKRGYFGSSVSGASPEKPSSRSGAGVTSMMCPRTKGPLSAIVTSTERPPSRS
jgi:hypothetical protein